MAVTAATESTYTAEGRLRRMDPGRDLGIVADLIADAFGSELDERGQAALREIRWMARLSPLVWWWAQADPGFRDTFNGFVWEEPEPAGKGPLPTGRGGQIVGNVSLNRAPGSRQRWIICNVVVQEAYRGQGIGRRLTEEAILEAQALGAEGVVLQVHQDNPSAWGLYTDLGFREAAGETDLRLESVEPVVPRDAPGYQFRTWRPGDGRVVYELARQVTPPVQQWIKPVRLDSYQLSWWTRAEQWLRGLVGDRRVYRVTALREGGLVAMMTVTVAYQRGEHHLDLLIHPDHAGELAAALVSRALHMLAAIPPRPVRATVDRAQTATLETLREYGFEEQRTLLTLRKDFT